jgi:hypothetical protein
MFSNVDNLEREIRIRHQFVEQFVGTVNNFTTIIPENKRVATGTDNTIP